MFSTETLQTQKQFEITKKEKVLQISSCVQPVFISQSVSTSATNCLLFILASIFPHWSVISLQSQVNLCQYIPEQNFHIVESSISK